MRKRILFLLMFSLSAVSAFAGPTVFADNFNAEHGGVGVLNYTGFANWTVTNGTVDLIGNGFHDFLPGNGLYVDMDGSTNNAGLMTSNINLGPGTYFLNFDLAGNHRNGSQEYVDVKVTLGGLFSGTYSLNQNDPFTTFQETFTVSTAATVALSFEGVGGDNIGMLLDNVSISSVVPAPAAILLGGIGVTLVGWLRRRRTL